MPSAVNVLHVGVQSDPLGSSCRHLIEQKSEITAVASTMAALSHSWRASPLHIKQVSLVSHPIEDLRHLHIHIHHLLDMTS